MEYRISIVTSLRGEKKIIQKSIAPTKTMHRLASLTQKVRYKVNNLDTVDKTQNQSKQCRIIKKEYVFGCCESFKV